MLFRSPSSPHAEAILRTAAKLGVKHYRLGWWHYKEGQPTKPQLDDIKPQLRDLAAMNKQFGLCGILQNHAGKELVGAKVWDYIEIVQGENPKQIGVAFDIGHALNELRTEWRAAFKKLGKHFRIAYIKDWSPSAGYSELGKGEIEQSGYKIGRAHV